MRKIRFLFLLMTGLICGHFSFAQKKEGTGLRVLGVDSVGMKKVALDSNGKKKHDPHKATMHSLMVPGWGQFYNHSYWKIPLMYAALGITGAVFNFNRVEYNKTKFAYFAVINNDTASFKLISEPALRKLAEEGNSYALQTYRNEYRKDIDYSVLFFIFFWALNVVDATVDGHLKDFDVSNNLSFKVKPVFGLPGTPPGVSLVFNIGKHPVKHTAFIAP